MTNVLEGQRSYDVTLRLPDSARTDLESIRKIPIDTLNGQLVPLGLVAHPKYPELEDFCECSLVADNGATGYFRVDCPLPTGLAPGAMDA